MEQDQHEFEYNPFHVVIYSYQLLHTRDMCIYFVSLRKRSMATF